MQKTVEEMRHDFDEFAYIISHDLGAPLRHVREFSKLLMTSLQENLDQDQQDYKHYVEAALAQIEQMQEALLLYSRVQTRGEAPEPVRTNDLVQEICDDIKGAHPEETPEITVQNLPDVMADPKQIRYVFEALLDNAVKFRTPGQPIKIEIGTTLKNNEQAFYVRDNGVGLDPKLCEIVFTLFRKGHSNAILGGIGAGLTIAKKIVERHGGRIWMRSESGDGTSVFFTLPLVRQ